MREMLTPTSLITGLGMEDKVFLITDGRFSGGSHGAAVGHVSPEAAQCGTIALVEEGDTIELDIPGRRIRLAVEDAEIRRRKEAWRPPAPKVTEGALAEYALRVSSASRGAVRLRLEGS